MHLLEELRNHHLDTLSARPCHLMPSCPTDGVASISTGLADKTKPQLSPAGRNPHPKRPRQASHADRHRDGHAHQFLRHRADEFARVFRRQISNRRRFSSTAPSPPGAGAGAGSGFGPPGSSRAHAPVPISSALTISAYTLRSMCVTSVISATLRLHPSWRRSTVLCSPALPRPTARRRRRPRSPRADARRAPAARISP